MGTALTNKNKIHYKIGRLTDSEKLIIIQFEQCCRTVHFTKQLLRLLVCMVVKHGFIP